MELVSSSAVGAALLFGFRHGFDWDHLAALTDLTGAQASRRRAMVLATLYALGHAAMVLVLGIAVISFARQVPAGVDEAMGRLVGASLLGLGAWIAWTALRTRQAPTLRSRWMLLLDGVRGLLARRRRRADTVVIEHSHPHDHGPGLHEHRHRDAAGRLEAAPVAVGHAHVHRHVAVVPDDPFDRYGRWSAFGIGVLHGIGAETPTQVVIFAAAAHASGTTASLTLLATFVVGLLAANSVIAAASAWGFSRVLKRPAVAAVVALATATFSIVYGTSLLLGASAPLG